MSKLDSNSSLFFLLKSPIRKIGGFGRFNAYIELSIDEAWNKFGINNGVNSKNELIRRNNFYTSKHSTADYLGQIGCILIDDAEFFSETAFVTTDSINVSFPKQIVKYKYFTDGAHSWIESNREEDPITENFLLQQTKHKSEKYIPQRQREGQTRFRVKILKAYGNKCAVTGTSEATVLEAAHI